MKGNEVSHDDRIYKILIVDDDKDVLDSMKLILRNAFQLKSYIKTAMDSRGAIAEIQRQPYDVVISDYKMPGMNGIDLLAWIRKKHPQTTRILITGYPSIDVAREAINKANVHFYIEKPWDNDELRHTIYEAMKREENIEVKGMPDCEAGGTALPAGDAVGEKSQGGPDNQGTSQTPDPKRIGPDIIGVDDANQALKMLESFEKTVHGSRSQTLSKKTLMLEFNSITEFNRFSFEIEKMENAKIKEVRIFENKYIISVLVYPSTYQFVS